ncbi:D-alanine--D-serine ligase VanG [Anaerolentibacter hominis]|uniref:D-alanine--D-serine ligase VanG n=1 Tax=Anaerolentibacter hominis TaxID=3079009 RepID=UPI0031B87452
MEREKVAVLFGGCSTEYSVSLQSAYAVITHIDTEKYEPVLIGITREGKWFHYFGNPERIPLDTWLEDEAKTEAAILPDRQIHGMMEWRDGAVSFTRLDFVFPVLHGRNGEDGTVQGLIELAGIPLVGCATLCSALCMDKQMAHERAAAAGVAVPKAVQLLRGEEKLAEQKAAGLTFPLYVKPVRAGSSYGITRIEAMDELSKAVETAFEHDSRVIIEEEIKGFEVGCAVLGNEDLVIGEVDEIELVKGFFDYTEKYSLVTARIHMPARIDSRTAARIKETAALLYRVLDCRGFARVDMFLTPDQEIVFNEVNTIPGCTSHSRYPNMLKGAGISFAEMVNRLIDLARE